MSVSDQYLRNLLRKVVHQHADGHCEFPCCDCMFCDPHHWVTKKNLSIRYDPDACINLCVLHHTSGPEAAHIAPKEFEETILYYGVRTEEWISAVIIKKNIVITEDIVTFRESWKIKLLAELF